MLFSSKVTHSILKFLESQGLDSEKLCSLTNTPEEFLKDPSSWQPAKNIELFLAKSESLFKDTVKKQSDHSLIQYLGHQCVKLQSWGVLDGVLKMIQHPQQFYKEPANFLSYFISPTPPITQLQITTAETQNTEPSSFSLSFCLDFNTHDFPYFVSYLTAVLEALPTYLNHSLAHVSWKDKKINIVWKDQQTSFFQHQTTKPIHLTSSQKTTPIEKSQKQFTKRQNLMLKDQPKQLHLSQNDPHTKNQQERLEKLDTWEKLTHQLAQDINPYILKSLNNTQKLKDYFVRARQILTILISQEKHQSYIKDSMKKMNWDFVCQEFSSLTQDSMQDLLKVTEVLESLLLKTSYKTKVDLNHLLRSTVEESIDYNNSIKAEYHFAKLRKIIVFQEHLKQAFTHLIRASISVLNGQGIIKISTRLKRQRIEIEISNRGNFSQQSHDIHLSIAHWLIRMHNGKIEVQKYFDKEITFLTHIPLGDQYVLNSKNKSKADSR